MDCNNGSHQNSDTEVILATTELGGESKNDTNRHIVDELSDENVSVQNEICRGQKLRAEKPRHNKTVTSISVLESFKNQTCVRKNNKRPSPSSRSTCPCGRSNSVANTYLECTRISRPNLIQTKAKKGKRCPLRIAELAVPSKRQCIGTWREKCDILPGYMVERLKQHVMDQVPIAKIPEAIYCFKREKRLSSKKWLPCEQKQSEAQKPSRQMDSTMLCILFAHRVTKKLSGPLKLKLDSNLENLSKVVSDDIAKMMDKCQGSLRKDRKSAIHRDVTNKITFWITGILEDLSVKLLEDDLKAEMKAEAITQTMAEFATIANTVMEQETLIKSKDLEEEEGPVLDFIDEVVDNVMNVCEPQKLQIDTYSSDLSSSTQDIRFEEESEKSHEYSDSETTKFHESFNSETSIPAITAEADDALEDSYKDLSNSEHFRNEISNIINQITKESGDIVMDIEKGSRDDINEDISLKSDIKHDVNVGNNEEVSTKVEMDHDMNDENNKGISLDVGAELNTNVENSDGILLEEEKYEVTNDENFDQINESSSNVDKNNENADETHSNVSERFEIVNDDSKTDLVNAVTTTDITSTTEELKSDQHKKKQWNSENNKSNIMFAEPNQDLLSDADESWPTDFGDRPMLKVSDSASKSVSSLGRINEHDENIILSPEEDEKSVAYEETGDTSLQVNAVMEILDTMLPDGRHPATGIHDTASQEGEPLTKVSIETSTTGEKQVSSNEKKKFPDENDISKTITLPETSIDKTGHTSSKLEKHQRDSDLIRKGSKADGTVRSKVDLGWKVHPKTAPFWVHAWGQGRGEPSEDSIPMQDRPTKVTEKELRTWCKDLEKAFINLEIWNDWISTTCNESLYILKQKRLGCPGLAREGAISWNRLKRNVHKDALLWTKLYQRTDKNFKSLKRKYNNVEYSKPTPISTSMIFEKLREFEDSRVDLHNMIVAAEYKAMCTCVKTKTRCHSNKDCRNFSTT